MLADERCKALITKILTYGCLDENPRPHYEDIYDEATKPSVSELAENQWMEERDSKYIVCTPAHTLSINHVLESYDISGGELPLITLRPIAIKSSIGELLWIYQDQSNDLNVLRDKYGVTWWDEWDIGNRTIGCCYGETVRRHDLMNRLLDGIKNDPDGRRHIINMWQEDDFTHKHGLKPCAYQTIFNVRHEDGIDYLDMMLFQRSSDYGTAGIINQIQYIIFQMLVARHIGYIPGKFSWCVDNIQIYDRHIENMKTMHRRQSIPCHPYIWLNPEKTNFYDFTVDDIKIMDYPREEIKKQNPQLKFQIAI